MTIKRLTDNKEFKIVNVLEQTDDPGLFQVALEPVEGQETTCIGYLANEVSFYTKMSNKRWDRDELRECAIEWFEGRMNSLRDSR